MKRIQKFLSRAFTISLLSCLFLLACHTSVAHSDSLAKYLSMREQMVDDRDGHLAMARWAREHGLAEQSRAHLLRLLDFDPENQLARGELGHVNIDGRWLTKEQFDEWVTENNRRMKSYRQWAKPVAYATERLISPNESNQRRGQKMLGAITNPEATYAIEYFLCSQAMPIAEIGIQKIYGFDGREATGSLLRVALYHNEAAARQTACEMLDKRNAAEFIPELIGMLESPVTSEYILTSVGAGQILHRHVFFQQRFDQDVVRQYDQMYVANLVNPTRAQPDPVAVNQLLANNLRTGRVGTERMEQAVLAHNLSVEQKNVRLIDVLRSVTSEDAGSTPEDWWNWWYDQNDIKMYQRPVSYRSESLGTTVTSGLAMRSGECFVAGTLVWTDRGLRAIEFLRTGDRVWAQDLKSKQMVYRNVITLTTREPSPTLLIQLPNEVLQVSDGHPFHVDGEGWMRARDLKRGTKLTGRQGVVSIENVSHGSVEPLFNLVVERDSNYFVGTAGVLSHDHTIPTSPVIIPAR